MAHLVRCWCGKRYRCDIEHPKTNRLTFMEERHEDNCPDFVLHGPIPPPKFTTITSEKFQTPLVWGPATGKLSDIIEANSMKEIVDADKT